MNLIKIGNFLFRWRGLIPWILIILLWRVINKPEYVELNLGELWDEIYELFCFSISFLGFIVRFIIRGKVPEGTSGRNTKKQKAESLNTKGFYSIVRHPIYILGNFPIFLGILLFTQIWWIVAIGFIFFWIYYLPIMKAEEAFLKTKFGELWENWAKKTPFIFPNFKLWRPFDNPFSLKRAIKKEYTTFFLIISLYAVIDILRDLLTEKELDVFWIFILTLSGYLYVILKFLKKNTDLFKEKD